MKNYAEEAGFKPQALDNLELELPFSILRLPSVTWGQRN